ncbi:acyl-CoA dehydrogenase family protein [Nocardia sp. BMG51109]|uniref:acyl-CoA dehydrogenase family protein n=1 Tax=Nocardia sp. BMG51109 TaxID=1056816 RepID=UPI0018DDE488|nr:acyl-CoA dehydrogenase family protein [Nocardia sp. BMG51109]
MTSTHETTPLTTDFDSVLTAVGAAVPALRDNGIQAEADRWLPEESIRLLTEAGVFRVAVPERFGGLELPVAQVARVLAEVGRGCGSSAWTASAATEGAYLASLLPDRAQEEIFADIDTRFSISVAPTSMYTETDGGYKLNGACPFASGCRGAEWSFVAGALQRADGSWGQLLGVVPTTELVIVDDWQVSAAAGTGSCTITIGDVFVPAHRVITVDQMFYGGDPSRAGAARPGRTYAFMGLLLAESAATIVGTARGAYELFLERVPGKPITFTTWFDQAQHPITHAQIGTAAAKLAAAEALLDRCAALLQDRADARAEPTVDEKLALRGHAGYAVQLAREVVDDLYTASGGSVIRTSNHFQRFHRDVLAFANHGLLQPSVGAEAYGRSLLGLEPTIPLI